MKIALTTVFFVMEIGIYIFINLLFKINFLIKFFRKIKNTPYKFECVTKSYEIREKFCEGNLIFS